MSLRRIIFWLHFAAGLVAGAVIGIMSFTGVVLAFEHEIVAWAERDARQIQPPGLGASRLPLDELVANARAAFPEQAPSAITVAANPGAAVVVAFGRDAAAYVNPYTGEVRQPASTAVHDFMHLMIDWHRWLALSGEQRATGRAITGACNAAFLVLGLTGLYLWWPRSWSSRVRRPSLWFIRARGKARDWNWHNVIGFWTLPVLLLLSASGMVISYRWASDLVYRAFGEEPPQQQGPAATGSSVPTVSEPASGATPLSRGSLFAAAEAAVPTWETISLRLGAARGGGGPSGSAARGREAAGPQPVSLTVRERDRFPTFASTTLVFDPFTGTILSRTGFADLSSGRQTRMWLRWLHVGQGFGWGGQLIALLASLGALVLVYTGFALAWRRLFPRKAIAASPGCSAPLGARTATLSRE